MRRYLPLYFAFLMLLATTAFAQDHGRLVVTVQTRLTRLPPRDAQPGRRLSSCIGPIPNYIRK